MTYHIRIACPGDVEVESDQILRRLNESMAGRRREEEGGGRRRRRRRREWWWWLVCCICHL